MQALMRDKDEAGAGFGKQYVAATNAYMRQFRWLRLCMGSCLYRRVLARLLFDETLIFCRARRDAIGHKSACHSLVRRLDLASGMGVYVVRWKDTIGIGSRCFAAALFAQFLLMPAFAQRASSANRTTYEKLAPPMSQAMAVNVKGAVAIETCRLVHKVSFTSDGFKVVGVPPKNITKFAIVKDSISFSDGTVIRKPSFENPISTTIKGFGEQSFIDTKYFSYNTTDKAPMKDKIGTIELSKTFETSMGLGSTSVVLMSVNGSINGINIFIERSNNYGYSPLNILHKTSTESSWDYFVGACRVTSIRQ